MKSKEALDKIIRKSRVHLYKPIQIAEILYQFRTKKNFDISDIESYRNPSKKWRDNVTRVLIGRVSTSSQKFQDNLFEANAMPSYLLKELAEFNNKNKGLVENYIYQQLHLRLNMIFEAYQYLDSATTQSFKLEGFISLFIHKPGLRRSIDKAYEIIVYALFSTIVRALNVEISIQIKNEDEDILDDFNEFVNIVLGLSPKKKSINLPAKLFRVGVTNAADRGLDMWTNFGPAIQVKHVSLSEELAEDVSENITADRIIIVCLNGEKGLIEKITQQLPFSNRIQGIITFSDLVEWYKLCLSKKYEKKLSKYLISDLKREFSFEFPGTDKLEPFMCERDYDGKHLFGEWKIN